MSSQTKAVTEPIIGETLINSYRTEISVPQDRRLKSRSTFQTCKVNRHCMVLLFREVLHLTRGLPTKQTFPLS